MGKAGLDRVLDALDFQERAIPDEADRYLEAYVVLGLANGERREFVAAEKATVVRDRLRDYGPQNGGYGSFWWITVDFMPASTMRLASDAPF